MELSHTEELEYSCLAIAVDNVDGDYYIALGMAADIHVYEFEFFGSESCFADPWPGFRLQAVNRSICFWDEEEDDSVDFKLLALKQHYLVFAVNKKLYVWDWVNGDHLHTVICPTDIHFLQLNAGTLMFGGYEDLRLWSVTAESSQDLVGTTNRVYSDRIYNQLSGSTMNWCVDQQLHMDIVLRTNGTLKAVLEQTNLSKITAFHDKGPHGPIFFAGIAENGFSYLKRVDGGQGITASRAVSNARQVSELLLYDNMLCTMDIWTDTSSRFQPNSFYFCNYDAVTLRPIHQQRVIFQNDGLDWANMALLDNYVLLCGASSPVLHLFERKYWDKKAIMTFLLCLRRTDFLPELTMEVLIPFLFAVKFERPIEYYDDCI